MVKSFLRTTYFNLLILSISIVFISPQSSAGDYLNELASEAEATANVSRQNRLDPSDKKQMKAMELLLKDKKPSTYKYYVKLNKKNKVRAFEQYTNDQSNSKERLSHLQKKVMDLYFEQ